MEGRILVISHINYFRQEIELSGPPVRKGIRVALEPKSTRLSDVVISASLYEQPVLKLTRSASAITHRQIVDRMNSNLTDLLASTPGFTQVWEYHSPIILRGLNSNRLIIMKDGNRRIGTFPGGYFGQDMDVYGVRRVEIIKGPGSVIYGSGAISGIINMISPSPFGRKETSASILSGYGSNNQEFLESVRVCHKREKTGVSLHGKYRKTGDMVYGNGAVAQNSAVEDRDLALHAGGKIGERHEILFHAGYHYGDWGKPRGFNGPTKHFTRIRNVEDNLHTALTYSFRPGPVLENLEVNLFYDDGRRDYHQAKFSQVSGDLSSEDIVHYRNKYGGGRAFAVLRPGTGHRTTLGVDGYLFRLDNPTDVIDYYYDTRGRIDGYRNAGQQNLGGFINEEWQVSEKLLLAGGVRYDAAGVLEGEHIEGEQRRERRRAFSGNAGLVYSPVAHTHFSFNAGRAFRMPTAEELFTRIISCKGIKVGNPDLKPEYSWNLDLGWRGTAGKEKLTYDLSLFFIQLEGFINEAPVADDPDIDFTYTNTNARLAGGEFSAAFRFDRVLAPSNTLYAGLGAAYVYGVDLTGGNDAPLFGIPPFRTTFDLRYRGLINKCWITGYLFRLETEMAAAQNRIAPVPEGTEGGPWGYVPSDPHAVLHLSAGINSNSLPGSPKLRLIVKNLLDQDYQPFGSYIPAMGRNIKLVLTFNF
jgi:outer membrane receptor protein involved in Fe transport